MATAVGGGFGVEGGLVEMPGESGLGFLVGADVGAQVGGHPSLTPDLRHPGGDGFGVWVVAAAEAALQAAEVVAGPVELPWPEHGRRRWHGPRTTRRCAAG